MRRYRRLFHSHTVLTKASVVKIGQALDAETSLRAIRAEAVRTRRQDRGSLQITGRRLLD